MSRCCKCNRRGRCKLCSCAKRDQECHNCLPHQESRCNNISQSPQELQRCQPKLVDALSARDKKRPKLPVQHQPKVEGPPSAKRPVRSQHQPKVEDAPSAKRPVQPQHQPKVEDPPSARDEERPKPSRSVKPQKPQLKVDAAFTIDQLEPKAMVKPDTLHQQGIPPGESESKTPTTVTVLSWNIQGCGDSGLSKARNKLVPKVVKELHPGVLLLQETKPAILVKRIAASCRKKYNQVMAGKADESQILYNPDMYSDISTKKIFPNKLSVEEALALSIIEKIPEARPLKNGTPGGMRKDFGDRLSCVGLKRNGCDSVPQNVTVFMSYHNFNNSRGVTVRNKAAVYLCEIVEHMQRLTGARVVVGADLNLNIMEYQNRNLHFTPKQKRVIKRIMPTVLPYETTVWRMDKMIDFIFFNGPNDQIVEEVEALDFVIAKFDEDDCLHETMKHILPKDKKEAKREIKKFRKAVNHDPLVFKIMT